MLKEDIKNKFEMIDKMYNIREEMLGKVTKELKEKLNNVDIQDIKDSIEKYINNKESSYKIIEELDLLEEDYEIKIAEYNKEAYKQGFKDAFELFLECIQKKLIIIYSCRYWG